MFKHLNTRIPKRIEQEKDKVSAVMIPLIKKNDGWEFAGIYADKAITGTNVKKGENAMKNTAISATKKNTHNITFPKK